MRAPYASPILWLGHLRFAQVIYARLNKEGFIMMTE
jgi:hypothetical protein